MTTYLALVRALLGGIASRARLGGLIALGVVAVLVAFVIAQSDPASPTQAGASLINVYGLTILVPVVTLVFASAALGDLVDDQTLVYLWLRPTARWLLAAAAFTAALVVAAPVAIVPLVLAAVVVDNTGGLVAGATLGAALGVAGYTGVFVALGLMARRALAWGLLYILIWEGFVARAGTSSSQLSIQYYSRSALGQLADVSLRLSGASMTTALLIPVAVAIVGIAVTTHRLRRISVA